MRVSERDGKKNKAVKLCTRIRPRKIIYIYQVAKMAQKGEDKNKKKTTATSQP